MDLGELRNQLDRIDEQIVKLYEERMGICSQVADYKIENGKNVFDKDREAKKLQKVQSLAHNEYNAKGIQELFEQIMSMSRKLQYKKLSDNGCLEKLPFSMVDALDKENARVVFQGAEGAYSQMAMKAFFGEDVNCYNVDTFREAMSEIEKGDADFAVLPIENSTAGIVSEMYDIMGEFENYIVGEQIIRIEHCLMGLPGTDKERIRTVYSHPQSLMQSSYYLAAHPSWRQISMQNNAFAARKVMEDKDMSQAAIASEHAAKSYGLEILEKGVNHSRNNSTRFIIVTNRKIFLRNARKISICFELPHVSGSLYHILSHFIYNNLNMTHIESRPLEGRNWEYRFFIDFEGNFADSAVINALRGICDEARNVKILGNY